MSKEAVQKKVKTKAEKQSSRLVDAARDRVKDRLEKKASPRSLHAQWLR